MSDQKTMRLTDLLTEAQLDEVEKILADSKSDRMAASNALRRYLVTLRIQLEEKGCVPEYLAYVIAYRQWTGGDNGDRSVAFST